MSDIVKLPAISAESGFSKYLNEINNIPSLTKEEEFMLAKAYLEQHDLDAAHKLVKSHLKKGKVAVYTQGTINFLSQKLGKGYLKTSLVGNPIFNTIAERSPNSILYIIWIACNNHIRIHISTLGNNFYFYIYRIHFTSSCRYGQV